MGTKLTLTAADGFRLGAYRADPPGPNVRGGIVVIQEIFGVNHNIRSVCDKLADTGYRAIAPQLFDRVEPNFESGYTVPEVTAARELAGKLDSAKLILDAAAAFDALKREGPVAIMGFCLGGTVAFEAATRFGGLTAAVCFYGGGIIRKVEQKPKCPVQMHFGEEDGHIPMSDVEVIRQKRPECEVFTYPGAGHAFANEDRPSYELRSAKIAWQRSLAMLARAFASIKRPPFSPVPAAKTKTTTKIKTKAKSKPQDEAKPQANAKSPAKKAKAKTRKAPGKATRKVSAKRKSKARRR
jgi:carboxymethylenebutenolidase